jgi:hypothetical protein
MRVNQELLFVESSLNPFTRKKASGSEASRFVHILTSRFNSILYKNQARGIFFMFNESL